MQRAISFVRSYFCSFSGLPQKSYFGLILSLFEAIFIGIFYFLPIYFMDILHFDMSASGSIVSCYGIGSILGGILGGRLSDLRSPGFISSLCLFIQAVAYAIFTKIDTLPLLMSNAFILGLASYGFITANQLFVLEDCKKDDGQKLRAINISAMIANLGLGLTAIIMGIIYSIGFHAIFLIASATLLFLTPLSVIFSEYTKYHSSKNYLTKEHEQPLDKKIVIYPLINNYRIMGFVYLSVFFVGLVISQLSTSYSVYIRSTYSELGIQAVTLLFALNSFVVVIFSIVIGDYIKKFNHISSIGTGGFLLGFGMFMLIFSHTFIMAILACLIYTIGEIIFFSITQLVCYQNACEGRKGKSLGLYRTVFASSRVLGPVTGGVIYHKFGGNIIWIASGVIGFFCLFVANFLKQS